MRRTVVVLAALDLAAFALGYYGRFVRTPPPPPHSPTHIDDGKRLPTQAEFEELARTDPVRMYDACLKRYEREVTHGLAVTLVKRERVEGEPQPPVMPQEEIISLFVRGDTTNPLCIEVRMQWQSGAHKFLGSEIRGTLYSEKAGKEGTGGKVKTRRPDAVFAATSSVPITDPLAKKQSRYCIRDAGIYRGMLRTHAAWEQRQEAGTLRTEYLGKKEVPEVNGRVCLIVERTCDSPEADHFALVENAPPITDQKILAREGFTRVRVMIDAETWMQVGTELYRPDGQLLASYYFRNPNTNPTFEPDTFTLAGLEKK
jgi:hypothetical protein